MQRYLIYTKTLTKSIIKTQNRNYQIYEPISSLCERIGNSFVRINQGEVVRISLIAGIRGNIVYLKNGMEMAIGRTYRKSVMETYFGKKLDKGCIRMNTLFYFAYFPDYFTYRIQKI